MSFNNRNMQPGRYRFFPLAAAALLLGIGALVMWLWNAILPDLLQVRRIGYWQAVGLLALCRILFGNFGSRGGGRHYGPGMDKRKVWRDKWMQMSPEERMQFKRNWQDRCRVREHRSPEGGHDSTGKEI